MVDMLNYWFYAKYGAGLEAVKNLPLEFKNTHPNISWREMAGMRDKLIKVNYEKEK